MTMLYRPVECRDALYRVHETDDNAYMVDGLVAQDGVSEGGTQFVRLNHTPTAGEGVNGFSLEVLLAIVSHHLSERASDTAELYAARSKVEDARDILEKLARDRMTTTQHGSVEHGG